MWFPKNTVQAKATLVSVLWLLCSCGDSRLTREYWSNGKLKTEIEQNKEGKRHGVSKLYYENGNLEEESNWVEGSRTPDLIVFTR